MAGGKSWNITAKTTTARWLDYLRFFLSTCNIFKQKILSCLGTVLLCVGLWKKTQTNKMHNHISNTTSLSGMLAANRNKISLLLCFRETWRGFLGCSFTVSKRLFSQEAGPQHFNFILESCEPGHAKGKRTVCVPSLRLLGSVSTNRGQKPQREMFAVSLVVLGGLRRKQSYSFSSTQLTEVVWWVGWVFFSLFPISLRGVGVVVWLPWRWVVMLMHTCACLCGSLGRLAETHLVAIQGRERSQWWNIL